MDKRRYRSILLIIFAVAMLAAAILAYVGVMKQLPDNLKLIVNEEEWFDYSLPIEADIDGENISVLQVKQSNVPPEELRLNFDSPFSIQAEDTCSFCLSLKLFGFITLKEIDCDVIDSVELVPGGATIGITLETDGLLVLGTGTVTDSMGKSLEPAYDIVKTGDYITKINGQDITEKEWFIEELQACGGSEVRLTVKRQEESVELSVPTVLTADGNYKIGVWIRDDTQGIGTLSFLTTSGEFGALGHGIVDVDTGLLLRIGSGSAFTSEIMSIQKGIPGAPGELSGIIHTAEADYIGEITDNTEQGIYGEIKLPYQTAAEKLGLSSPEALPIALRQEIKRGPATILSSVDGDVREYDIMIEQVDVNSANKSKGMVICITDRKLIELTGGIIQGMSGSPILQDGKIIGAVTHVFVKDSTRGYGIFIESMLEER